VAAWRLRHRSFGQHLLAPPRFLQGASYSSPFLPLQAKCSLGGIANYRTLQNQVRELHRLLGKKTLEAEILKEALEHATGSKKQLRLPPSPPNDGSR
jgi:hypothetical protein